ncbi:MAG: ArsA family ATPase [Actinobacteria bacterium]|nr:ArsA family ATPase [Actinomycetota bacterium]
MSLAERLEGARVIVVCGSGGVGKTTVSAAIALALAGEGRRTAVVAVDPARRLATSLALPRDPGGRRELDLGGPVPLTAMVLDTKRTFDELVERHAGSAARRDRILSNRFYQRIADTLSGTHEYMAMERLHQLATEEDFEVIVIDTPPSRSALAFLDAPRRLTDFLGGRFIRWLLWPYRRAGRAGMRGASLGARMLSRTIGRIAGAELLEDTAEFLAAFEGMYEGFKRRAAEVLELLGRPDTRFVVVTAPEPASLEEGEHFVRRLRASGITLAGAVVNRWRRAPEAPEDPSLEASLAGGEPAGRAVAACLEVAARLRALEGRGRAAVEPFRRSLPDVPLTLVEERPTDVHDVEGLAGFAEQLLRRP